MGGDNGEKGKDCHGTCIKDSWTNREWKVGMAGVGGTGVGKWRQLYLNIN